MSYDGRKPEPPYETTDLAEIEYLKDKIEALEAELAAHREFVSFVMYGQFETDDPYNTLDDIKDAACALAAKYPGEGK